MSGYSVDRERDALDTTVLGQDESGTVIGALVDRHAAAQVRQGERRFAVAAVRCADKLEQRRVFRNCEELPFTKRPARRSKIAGKHSNFTQIRLRHGLFPNSAMERCLAARCKTSTSKKAACFHAAGCRQYS